MIIQQRVVAHYRKRLFELLCSVPDLDIIVIADPEGGGTLKTLSADERQRIAFVAAPLRTIRLTRSVCVFWQGAMLKAMLKKRPAVIVLEGNIYSLTAWALAAVGRLRGMRVLLWSHGLLKPETGAKWMMRRAFYALGHGLILYGDYAKKLLVAKGCDPNRLFIVYNSLDFDRQRNVAALVGTDDIARFRLDLGVAATERLVAFTGRLQPNKRLDLLIEAIALLAARGQRVHAALIGDGDEKSALVSLSRIRGVSEHVHFLGESYDEEFIGLVYCASDLCVIPSGAGLTIMHSLAYGTPVLLHDRIGDHFPEWEAVVEGITGFFYRFNDMADMAARMNDALFPIARKQRMRDNCMAVVRDRYNPQRHADAFANAIRAQLR